MFCNVTHVINYLTETSLVPHGGLDLHAVSLALASFSRPELPDELEVLSIVEVHLAVVVVLKLRMFVHFSRDLLASEAPDTFNLEVWLFIEDAHLG